MDPAKPTLHALLVGINAYHPDSHPAINSLAGTHEDIEGMEMFLKNNYAGYFENLHIHSLKDHCATYTNIINSFYENLCKKAQVGDVVLFHFSGHGSFQASAIELWPLSDGKRQDETLVCYDSRLPGHFDLSDKELAVLLSHIPSGVDVIVLSDSCFSGSITRDDESENLPEGAQFRHLPRSKDPRILNTYFYNFDEPKPLPSELQNYYLKLQNLGTLLIPSPRHLVFTACTREQKAIEYVKGGYFSQTLLSILEQHPLISYMELFQRMRSKVEVANEFRQTPTLEDVEGFNCKQFFLKKETDTSRGDYHVYCHDGEWRMYYGALFGLEIDESKKTWVNVYSTKEPDSLPLRAYVEAVTMNYATLNFEPQSIIHSNKEYKAEIISLSQPKVKFYGLNKDSEAAEHFKTYVIGKTQLITFTNLLEAAEYELQFDEVMEEDQLCKRIGIYHRLSGKLIHGVIYPQHEPPEAWYNYLIEILLHIEKWERLYQVQRTNSPLSQAFSWHLEIQDQNGQFHPISQKDCTVVAPENGVPFKIMVKNQSTQPLYLSLFYFLQEDVQDKETHRGYIIHNVIPQNYFLKPENQEYINVFSNTFRAKIIPDSIVKLKIVASTIEIDDFLYTYTKISGLEGKNGFPMGIYCRTKDRYIDYRDTQEIKIINEDWFVENLNVRVIRTKGDIQQESITNGHIRILKNEELATQVNIGNIGVPGGDAKTILGLAKALDEKQLTLCGFGDQEYLEKFGNKARTTIELNEVPSGKLPSPLQIQVDQKMLGAEGALTIPVAYDDDNDLILPFGALTTNAQGLEIAIDAFPEAGADKTRSLGRAIVFGLLKIGLKVDTWWLRSVDYHKTSIAYIGDQAAIKNQVKSAQRILLLVHGFLGNTRNEAEIFRNAVNDGHFDLVLTFDYENLNSSVIQIAKELHLMLCDPDQGLGLGDNDGKHLTVVAHSLGGLVARYWVEQLLRGKDTVDKLVLVGVPNGGSSWGKTSDWIGMFNTTLGLLLNVATGQVKSALGNVQKLIGAANTQESLKTLSEMKPDSDILNILATAGQPSHTHYVLIAGNANRLKEENDNAEDSIEKRRLRAKFKHLWFKLGYTVGQWFYSEDEPHDCFATVKSQLNLPFTDFQKYEIPAHHYGYFEHNELEEAMIIPLILSTPTNN